MPSGASSLAFARNCFAEITVVMPHCAIAAAMASRPAVKFRFTGTLPAMSTARLASAAGIDAGSSSPTIACPSHVRRTHRDSSSAATSMRPYDSSRPEASAIAKRPQCRLAVRITRRCSTLRRSSRRVIASLDSSAIAWRASAADVVAGIGAPKLTDTGYGICSGHFQKKRPCLKLKTLPHSRSRHTGITGTSSPSTMRSKPRLNGSRLPVRLMAPSAKMQTTWPRSSSARACAIEASTSCRLPPATGIARIIVNSRCATGRLKYGR